MEDSSRAMQQLPRLCCATPHHVTGVSASAWPRHSFPHTSTFWQSPSVIPSKLKHLSNARPAYLELWWDFAQAADHCSRGDGCALSGCSEAAGLELLCLSATQA